MVVRVMVASAKECLVYRAGGTLVPPELREFAGLKTEVMIAGALESFEIWSRECWCDMSSTTVTSGLFALSIAWPRERSL